MAPSQLFTISLFLLIIPFAFAQTPTTIGFTYNTSPSTSEYVARFVESANISAVRLLDANPDVIRSFSSTNVSLLVTIPNSMVPEIGANRSNAVAWIYQNVVPYYPRARISAISVGNNFETFSDIHLLLPAIKNIHNSLHEIGIQNISVSTTFYFYTMITDISPSCARLRSPADYLVITPVLQFLEQTKSSLFIDMYPYDAWRLNPEIPIEFALFQNLTWELSGFPYSNLFDMMVDAVHSAMAASGHQSIPIIVTGTGWPSSGYTQEVKATQSFAEKYVTGFWVNASAL
uniref:Glucan endo-1,3-beta-D-glucosidase n=1 Tax=Kalanchoe fedtschenkoi TaxID=63787 RepID=A0A7N0UX98_KALFE